MTTAWMPLFEPVTEKGREGEKELSQWRVAIEAYRQMTDFLHLTPGGMRFTDESRQSIRDNLQRLAMCIGQMDSGQRGRGVNFDEVPHIMARICAGCMLMELSGALDRLEVDA